MMFCTVATGLIAQQDRIGSAQDESYRWGGSYLSISGSVGVSGLDYELNSLGENGSGSSKLGFGVDFRYSYYFDNHWGFATGLGISRYANEGKLAGSIADGSYFNLGMLTDDDLAGRPIDFELRARLSNLEERQTTFFLDVPIMLMYQTRFGEEEKWGMYGGVGVKLQFPFSTKYKIRNGSNSQLNVSGYYPGIPVDMGAPSEPPVPQHGYGTISDPNSIHDWDGDGSFKMGVAGTIDLGVIIGMGESTDLMIGGYLDYGLTNVKKNGNRGLLSAPEKYHPAADSNIGNGITYNGMMHSDVTGKIKPVSFGGKITLRFKMGQ